MEKKTFKQKFEMEMKTLKKKQIERIKQFKEGMVRKRIENIKKLQIEDEVDSDSDFVISNIDEEELVDSVAKINVK